MNRNAELAQQVIASDGRINEVQRAVSGVVTMTIATQQPVARDLRFLLALDRVTYELERMGDHAGSVAKQARKLAGATSMVTYDELTPMATLAARQVRDVVMALVDIDEARARTVAARDDEIDRHYHQLFDDVLDEMRTDPDKVDPGTRIVRGPLHRTDRRSRNEHRRGHRLSCHGRGGRPEPVGQTPGGRS